MTETSSVRLAVRALLEVVDSGARNMEVAVVRWDEPAAAIPEAQLAAVIAELEQEAEEAKKSATASETGTAMPVDQTE
jgi:20S proteasome subunit alpha 4